MSENIVEKIVEMRKKDIEAKGFSLGFLIPEKRNRPVNPFMQKKGVILEIKRASPSKGDIAPNLDPVETAKAYRENGAAAISCLTEQNFFKGSLEDLMKVCYAVPDVAVLRKDFLLSEEEIDISFRCGADAVLLIAGILSLEKLLSMAKKCATFGIRALVEVRSESDVEKALELKKHCPDTVVCGVNSRNLRDFSIDLLVPCMLKKRLGGSVIFESGITTGAAAEKVSSMGFGGLLLGEFAARNPQKAGEFIKAFTGAEENLYGKGIVRLAEIIEERKSVEESRGINRPLVKICGLTRIEDVRLAEKLGADFTGFIFAKGFTRNVCGEKFNQMKDQLKSIKTLKVGVVTQPFGEEALEACKLVQEGILDFIQIHGIDYDEFEQLSSIYNYNAHNSIGDAISYKEIPYYFALTDSTGDTAGTDFELKAKTLFEKGEARFLQDSKKHNYKCLEHLWLAGGVTVENVSDLISRFKPELVDISSGVEGPESGIKDEKKMRKFFERITVRKI